jgi:Flp pilus assembly protein TadG
MKFHKQTGVAAVELALILVPMLILCVGIAELGRALYQYDGMVKAGRGAARYLTQQSLSQDASFNTAVSVAKSLAVCGKSTCAASDQRLVAGLDDVSQVSITKYANVPTGKGTVSLVLVTISDVQFKSVFPGPGLLIRLIDNKGTIAFAPSSITMTYSAI